MPVMTTGKRVVATDLDATLVDVRYIGKGSSYNYSPPREVDGKPTKSIKFFPVRRGGQPVRVTLRIWNHLKKQRNPEGLREFALVGSIDKEVVAQDRARSRIGEFITKRAAMDYAADQFSVQLIATLSLQEMNAATVILKQRQSAGWSVEQMVDGLKGAYVMEAESEDDEVDVVPVKPVKLAPVIAEDDDDEIKELLTQEPEGEVEVEAKHPPPSVRIPKPAPRVREMP